ncbi:MAG TPA: MAPEG family protein [Rhizomicrobium sp.]
MIRKQFLLLPGAVPAAIIAFLVCVHAARLFGFVALPPDDTAERLGFAVRWLLLPGLTLWAGVQFAGRRGFYPGLIDGARDPSNHGFEINLRQNTNTLEQVVLAAIAWSGLALALPQERLVLIPAMAFLFVAGRITFWIGYFINPLARSFGMVLTALPTIGAYAWLVWRMIGPAP